MKLILSVVGWMLSLCGVLLALATLTGGALNTHDGDVAALMLGAGIGCLVFAIAVNPLARKLPALRPLWARGLLAGVAVVVTSVLSVIVSTRLWEPPSSQAEAMVDGDLSQEANWRAVSSPTTGRVLAIEHVGGAGSTPTRLVCSAEAQNLLIGIGPDVLGVAAPYARRDIPVGVAGVDGADSINFRLMQDSSGVWVALWSGDFVADPVVQHAKNRHSVRLVFADGATLGLFAESDADHEVWRSFFHECGLDIAAIGAVDSVLDQRREEMARELAE